MFNSRLLQKMKPLSIVNIAFSKVFSFLSSGSTLDYGFFLSRCQSSGYYRIIIYNVLESALDIEPIESTFLSPNFQLTFEHLFTSQFQYDRHFASLVHEKYSLMKTCT